MAFPSVTYTFSNGTTANASQVNTNFTDIINGLSDGTKSLSIDALTCSGSATLNGAVTLGNASTDDVTINGSIAASIPLKTNALYDIGSSTLGLASAYLGSAGGLTTRVIGGATGSSWTMTLPVDDGVADQYLKTDGSGVTSWATIYTAPSVQKFTSTGTTAGYLFTVTAANATVGATYTNNGQTFTVLATIAGATQLFTSGAGAPAASGNLSKATGTGDATIAFSAATALAMYTTPAGARRLRARMSGGGGGGAGGAGAGGSTTGGNGGTGGITVFGTALLTANGGSGGAGGGANSGAPGGAASLGTGPIGWAVTGSSGSGADQRQTNYAVGGAGGQNPFSGSGGTPAPNCDGQAPIANTGAGGSGGSTGGGAGTNNSGAGGGAGGFVDAIINSPSASYYYCVGTAGSAGGAGTGGKAGSAGAAGLIIIEEHYQ